MTELATKRLLFWLVGWAFVGFFAAPGTAKAEPWLSTRFAQDCAGCHAPGRKNKEAMDRRCTLSCQGCHVNPNGGGLRSFYGKWNEDRWLRSFKTSYFAEKPGFAPTSKQRYAKKNKKEALPKEGFPLVQSENPMMNERHYTRSDGLEKEVSKDDDEFMYQVPEGDPLRQMDMTKVNAGGDIRYETDEYKRDSNKMQTDRFLMDADFGVEWRPVYHKVHVVYESRIEGSPAPGTRYEDVLTKGVTKSLYAMVDDLPFNTFVMYGYYRPLFGNFVPDHYTLAQELTSYGLSGDIKNYDLLYEAASIGTAPNVPYLNVHLIQKQLRPVDPQDATQGFAVNAGMRFVTLGASLNYSYWATTNNEPDKTIKTEMHSIGAAARIARTTASLEAVSVQRDVDVQDYRQGGAVTLDTQTQLWRENYATFLLAETNTTTDGLPGHARQAKIGIRSFLLAGIDVSLMLEDRHDEDDKDNIKTHLQSLQSQLHLFF